MTETNLRGTVASFNPDVVGISAATPNFPAAIRTARIVREATRAPLVIGGVHASALPLQVLSRHTEFEFAVVGEGERTMHELCQALCGEKSLASILGLAFRGRDGGIERTGSRPPNPELDSLPFPARDLVDIRRYRPQVYADMGRFSVSLITSRGCPAQCTFCASHITMGRRFRTHSVEYTIREMEHCMSRYGARHFVFKDDTFTCDKKRLADFCRALSEKRLNVEWFCYSRVDLDDTAVLTAMHEAGCRILAFGLESGSNRILESLKKGATVEQGRRALAAANSIGFTTVGSFILGNIEDDAGTMNETIEYAVSARPVLASFNRMVPYPGTEAFERIYGSAEIPEPDNWEDFTASGPRVAFVGPTLTRRDIQRITVRAYLRFYARPSQWWLILTHIRSFWQLLAYIRGSIAVIRQVVLWSLEIILRPATRGKRNISVKPGA